MEFRFALPIAIFVVSILGFCSFQKTPFKPQPKMVSRRSIPGTINGTFALPMDFLPFDPPLKMERVARQFAILDYACRLATDNTTRQQIKKITEKGYNATCSIENLACRCKAAPCSEGNTDLTDTEFNKLVDGGKNFTCSLVADECRCIDIGDGEGVIPDDFKNWMEGDKSGMDGGIETLINKVGSNTENISPAETVNEFFRPERVDKWGGGKFVKIIDGTDLPIGRTSVSSGNVGKDGD